MGAKAAQYRLVGRYINAADQRNIVGYEIATIDGSKHQMVSMEQLAFLVGRRQIVNCEGQLYQGKVLYRGVGITLDSLPSKLVSIGVKSAPATSNSQSQPRPTVSNTQTQTKPTQQSEPKNAGYVGFKKLVSELHKNLCGETGKIPDIKSKEQNNRHMLAAEFTETGDDNLYKVRVLCIYDNTGRVQVEMSLFENQTNQFVDSHIERLQSINDISSKSLIDTMIGFEHHYMFGPGSVRKGSY